MASFTLTALISHGNNSESLFSTSLSSLPSWPSSVGQFHLEILKTCPTLHIRKQTNILPSWIFLLWCSHCQCTRLDIWHQAGFLLLFCSLHGLISVSSLMNCHHLNISLVAPPPSHLPTSAVLYYFSPLLECRLPVCFILFILLNKQ